MVHTPWEEFKMKKNSILSLHNQGGYQRNNFNKPRLLHLPIVSEKLNSWSKKKMENFIWAKSEDYNLARASWKAPRTVLPSRSQGTVMYIFWDRGLYIKWPIINSPHNPDLSIIVAPYKIKKKCYHLRNHDVDAKRVLLSMAEQAVPPMGEVWWMPNANIQCTTRGRGGQRTQFFTFQVFLSCQEYESDFTISPFCSLIFC